MNAKNYWHCLLLCLCFCSCSSKESRFLEGLDAGVRFAQEKQPATIDFRDLTDFDWDKVFVFGPYTSPGTIQSDLGYEWPEATRTNIQESDGIALVVFVRDGRVTEHFSVPRSIADFTDLDRKHVFPREEAVFAVGRLTEVVDSNERTRFTLRAIAPKITCRQGLPPGSRRSTLQPAVCS